MNRKKVCIVIYIYLRFKIKKYKDYTEWIQKLYQCNNSFLGEK